MEIDVQQFKNRFNKPDDITINSIKIYFEINFNQSIYQAKSATFFECEFFDDVKFQKVDLKCGLKFENCIFHLNCNLISITANERNEKFNGDEFIQLHFINCKFLEEVTISGKIEGTLKFEKCNESFHKLILQSFETTSGRIVIHNSIINQTGNFVNIDAPIFGIEFRETTLNTRTLFEYANIGSLVFIKSTFKGEFWIREKVSVKLISFTNSVFANDFISWNLNLTEGIAFHETEFKNLCSFREFTTSENTEISFNSGNFYKGIELIGSEDPFPKIEIKKAIINDISKLDGQILIRNLKIKECNISGTNNKVNLIFNRVRFENLKISYFSNNNTVQFIAVGPYNTDDSKLTIFLSNLDKVQFIATNLANFKRITINETNLTGIICSNVTWFDYKKFKVRFIPNHRERYREEVQLWFINLFKNAANKKKSKYLSQPGEVSVYKRQRELFRQLKFAMEKQGDMVQYHIFKSYELHAYEKELKHSKGKWNEKIILWTGQSNNHGRSWIKPVLLSVPFVLFCYLMIITSQLDTLSFIPNFNSESISYTFNMWLNNFKIFFLLYNPAHRIDLLFVQNSEIKIGTSFWDIIVRIVVSYFIFQTVVAFRKYIK